MSLRERVGETTSVHEKVRGGELHIILGTMDTRQMRAYMEAGAGAEVEIGKHFRHVMRRVRETSAGNSRVILRFSARQLRHGCACSLLFFLQCAQATKQANTMWFLECEGDLFESKAGASIIRQTEY